MSPIPNHLNQAICQTIRHCGQQISDLAAQPFDVAEKGIEDYVTSVDIALDRQLTSAFTQLFPQDGVITEENERSRRQFGQPYPRLWLIDPLDGTEDFINSRPDYSVMVGLLQHYQPIAGWIYAPSRDQMYFGGVDWGLFSAWGDRPPQPLQVVEPLSPRPGYCPMLIGHRDQSRFGEAILRTIPEAQFSSLGSFGLKVLEVIQGRAGLYVYFNRRVKLWDTVGPISMAQQAGLICCDLEGQPLQFTPNGIQSETLAHQQPILIGWPSYLEALLPQLGQAVYQTLESR